MTPLVSAIFNGPALTEHHDLAPGQATIGHPVWGRRALLENLELRLGLPRPELDEAIRLQRWLKQLGEVATNRTCFYARSFVIDPIGTTKALLGWRDELVLGGWGGARVEGGGARLDTMADLEAGGHMAELAPGAPDRLRRVSSELADAPRRLFDAIELADELALWPALWRRVFELIEERGSPVAVAAVAPAVPRRGSDLAVVHALLSGGAVSALSSLRGDGSVLVLEGETSWELGQACAALLGSGGAASSSVVLRGGEVSVLNAALAARGLASQGWPARSGWRPALQVLPLALELAFEPRDPYRVLELLTLSGGPFEGRVGRELARALSAAPGIGGRPWRQAKERLLAAGVTQMELDVACDWLEAPGHSMEKGAPRAVLRSVVARVRQWLERRLANGHAALAAKPADARSAHSLSVLGAGWAQVLAFGEALEQVEQPLLPLLLVHQLLAEVASPSMLRLDMEQAGRVEHVEHAAAVRCARDEVVWWHCVSESQWRPKPAPWRLAERASLAAAGVCLLDGSVRLAAESRAWRQVVLAARERLVLAIPRTALGQSLAPHPILDMIAGGLGERASELTRLRVDVRDWLARGSGTASALGLDSISLKQPAPLALPEPQPEWRVRPSLFSRGVTHSARSLEWLAGCPLKWVLRYRAGLKPGFMEAIASEQRLNGQLGHRLLEELHVTGALANQAGVRSAAEIVFDRLVREEGAVLLRPGQASELAQLKAQLCQAIEDFASLLHASKLQISGVEVDTSTRWHGEALEGRIDILLVNAEGHEQIVDMKWGLNHYKQLLANGHALQLATYAAARQLATGAREFPAAAYYSLSRGKLLTTEPGAFAVSEGIVGPSLAETWQRLESTVELVQSAFAEGRVLVTGLNRSLPMVDERKQSAQDSPACLTLESGAACEYCDYPALCGRRWQEYA